MGSYKVAVENSTLGVLGTTVTDEDIQAAPADVELLVESGIVTPFKATKEKD